jgi:hypothetical protein
VNNPIATTARGIKKKIRYKGKNKGSIKWLKKYKKKKKNLATLIPCALITLP